MKRNRIILLVLLLAVLVIIPVAIAETNSTVSPTWPYKDVPEHYIPPEYFKDAKPASPVPETEMITIIISGHTFEQFSPKESPGIMVIPVRFLDFSTNFTNSTSSPTWHYEKQLVPGDCVAMIRMPRDMYDRFIKTVRGDNLELPVSAYIRQYDNLADLHAHIEPDGMYLKNAPPVSNKTVAQPSQTVPAPLPTTPHPAPVHAGIIFGSLLCAIFFMSGRER